MGRVLLSIYAVVVAVGLAGAAPQPIPQDSGKAGQAQHESQRRSSPVPDPPVKSVEEGDGLVLTAPCPEGQDYRKSDLCAQWKAADAARDAALWAMLGTIVGAIGTIGLYVQISLTRKAVADTGAATEAMRTANALQEVDLRPWMDIVPVEASLFHRQTTFSHDGTKTEEIGAGTPCIVAKVAFTNVGKSAAHHIFYKTGRLNGQWQVTGEPDIYQPNDERFFANVATKDGHLTTALMPGEKTFLTFVLALTDETMPVGEEGHRSPPPQYAIFITYRGVGIEGEGQTGKVLTFGREDTTIIDPAAPNLDGVKLWTIPVDRVRHVK